MRPLSEEIRDILTPRGNTGIIIDEKLYQLQPIIPIKVLMEMATDLEKNERVRLLKFLHGDNVIIYNGVVYIKQFGLSFQGRLKELLAVYSQYLNRVIGDKAALIKLYDTIPLEDIVNLVQDKVLFVMKNLANSEKRVLAAIRYLPDYKIHFENRVYKFPGCIIGIFIDEDLHPDNPEVISEGFDYMHPFVYRGTYKLGQKICMGSFYNSDDKKLYNKLRFANNINFLIKQAVQILVAGYNRQVTPANGHLLDPKYDKYLISKE